MTFLVYASGNSRSPLCAISVPQFRSVKLDATNDKRFGATTYVLAVSMWNCLIIEPEVIDPENHDGLIAVTHPQMFG